jgi:hypothetical protein
MLNFGGVVDLLIARGSVENCFSANSAEPTTTPFFAAVAAFSETIAESNLGNFGAGVDALIAASNFASFAGPWSLVSVQVEYT